MAFLVALLPVRTYLVAFQVALLPAKQETWVQSLGLGRSPGEGNDNPLQWEIPLTEEPGGAMGLQKCWTRLSN